MVQIVDTPETPSASEREFPKANLGLREMSEMFQILLLGARSGGTAGLRPCRLGGGGNWDAHRTGE